MLNILTTEERERLAYAEGYTETANLLAQLDDMERERDDLSEEVERLRDEVRDLEKRAENAEEYKQFFFDCFEHLAGHYPAPSVTSDYDKSVIFDTLNKAEGME